MEPLSILLLTTVFYLYNRCLYFLQLGLLCFGVCCALMFYQKVAT